MKKAFTLIELLLYLGLLTIVISAMVPFAWTVITLGQKSAVQQEVFNNARFVAEKLKQQIRNCTKVNTALSNFDTNLTGGGKISLACPSPDNSAEISVSGGKIYLGINGSTTNALNSTGTRVSELIFSNYSTAKSDNIGFSLTMTGAITSGSKAFQAQTQLKTSVEMRN